MENNTLDISWPDVQNYNEQLAAAISEEYYRFYPYLCRALKEFSLQHHSEIQKNKDIFVGFTHISAMLLRNFHYNTTVKFKKT